MDYISPQFFLFTLGVTFTFGGLLWRDLNDKVKGLQKEQSACPFPNMKTDIALIKQDIQWIKQNLRSANK